MLTNAGVNYSANKVFQTPQKMAMLLTIMVLIEGFFISPR